MYLLALGLEDPARGGLSTVPELKGRILEGYVWWLGDVPTLLPRHGVSNVL